VLLDVLGVSLERCLLFRFLSNAYLVSHSLHVSSGNVDCGVSFHKAQRFSLRHKV
jgi:hypothetical protein